MEPRSRRVAFLRTVAARVAANVHVERARSDRLGRGGWDLSLSRATLAPEEWLPEGARLARLAVWVLLARGDTPSLPGWRAEVDRSYEWPLTRALRRAVCFVPDRVTPPPARP